ncbi:SIR2 family protein [Cyclobacterium sp.]|uniref:SIR2 family protein n=1 Tax=Cyclobacterium sp. TaxID=1966343 RepID=UPI001990C636|nr:SIR2 family protein [Cyclobacterium sp.]MBD3628188.1 SIR2 family protein [Cyclobacterium sp.]
MEIFFYKGNENVLESKKEQTSEKSNETDLKKIQDSFLKALDNKNLSFLLGSGCSSFKLETAEGKFKEIGIPVMAPMASEFYGSKEFKEEKEWLKSTLSIEVDGDIFFKNLEVFLSTLHSLSFYLQKTLSEEEIDQIPLSIQEKSFADLTKCEKVESIILKARNYLLQKCLNEDNAKPEKDKPPVDQPLIELYKQFYRKLLTRNPTLPRLNIFTTNYDLFSERAMDLLGIHYVNGFTGGISKFFNPAIFNYALAEKMDLSQSKWSVIDNFFYLYKIHGSVNWIQAEGENKLFNVKEIQEPTFEDLEDESTIMIHPTPLKYNASLGSPYSDLFREFQKKLMQNNNILVTIGYSFSDEHINNLIFQAFTIPSFRLIVIGEPTEKNAIGKLMALNDSRIWIIGEKWPEGKSDYVPLHFFKRFVEQVLPDLTAEDLDKKMEKTIQNLKDLLK